MAWDIEKHEHVCLATMRSNPVNKINADFFADVHEFVDTVTRTHADSPIVLSSGSAKAFSAGLDFDYTFPIFASEDAERMRAFVHEYREIYYRLFSLPNPVVAAVDGPAIAGGFILMCCADYRIASRGRSKFMVNEVRIGIPMPAAYSGLIVHGVGTKVAEELILRGHPIDADEAFRLGVVHELVDSETALPRALEYAREIQPDCITAYRVAKIGLREPVVDHCRALGERYDESQLIEGLMTAGSVRMREKTRRMLADRKAR